MATISFDRHIEVKPEDMDRFLDALEANYPPITGLDKIDDSFIGEKGLEALRNVVGKQNATA